MHDSIHRAGWLADSWEKKVQSDKAQELAEVVTFSGTTRSQISNKPSHETNQNKNNIPNPMAEECASMRSNGN